MGQERAFARRRGQQIPRARSAVTRAPLGAPVRVYQEVTDAVPAHVEWVSSALMRIVRGEKRLRADAGERVVCAGELVFFPAGTRLDIRNLPDAGGIYEAEGVLFASDLARFVTPRVVAAKSAGPGIFPTASHPSADEALSRVLAGFADRVPPDVQRARMLELVGWLIERGWDPFTRGLEVRHRVRQMIGAAPADDWRLPSVAKALAMSEDTLQRHLRREGTGFQPLLAEIRMERALMLLWSTELPLAAVASESGYASLSRFAARFKQRYGVLPSEVRRT